MNSYILFYIGRKICLCFKFNGGSFIYLKLKDFDISFFFTLGSFLKFLKLHTNFQPGYLNYWVTHVTIDRAMLLELPNRRNKVRLPKRVGLSVIVEGVELG